jgi:hypothetical protein
MKSNLFHWGNLAILCLVSLLFVGCGGRTVDDTAGLQITLIPAPEGFAGAYLTAQIADATGAPVTDASVKLEGNMNHAGMAPVFSEAVIDDADGAVDGSYRVPFAFTMLGDWIITVSVERPDGTKATQNIDVIVGGAAVEVKGP